MAQITDYEEIQDRLTVDSRIEKVKFTVVQIFKKELKGKYFCNRQMNSHQLQHIDSSEYIEK